MPRRARAYQMAKMTRAARQERDRLVQQILDAVKGLYDQRLVRHDDLCVEQDEYGPHGAASTAATDAAFFLLHPDRDYRLNVVLAIRSEDR